MNDQNDERKRSFRGAAWKIMAAVGGFICLLGAASSGVLGGLLIANRDKLTVAPHQMMAVCFGIALFAGVIALCILTRLFSRWKGI